MLRGSWIYQHVARNTSIDPCLLGRTAYEGSRGRSPLGKFEELSYVSYVEGIEKRLTMPENKHTTVVLEVCVVVVVVEVVEVTVVVVLEGVPSLGYMVADLPAAHVVGEYT